MLFRQIYNTADANLVITIPAAFKNKEILVIIDDEPNLYKDKMAMMAQAAKDPLFLADLKETMDDFENIDHESL